MLGRLIVILVACLLASFTAGLVVSLAILIPVVGDLALGPFGEGTFGVLVAFGAIFVSAYALVPVLLVIVCAEVFSIRSLLFYAIAGGLLGAVLYLNYSGWDGRAFTGRRLRAARAGDHGGRRHRRRAGVLGGCRAQGRPVAGAARFTSPIGRGRPRERSERGRVRGYNLVGVRDCPLAPDWLAALAQSDLSPPGRGDEAARPCAKFTRSALVERLVPHGHRVVSPSRPPSA